MPVRGRFLPEDRGATHASSTVRRGSGYGKDGPAPPPSAAAAGTQGHCPLALTRRCPRVPTVPFSTDQRTPSVCFAPRWEHARLFSHNSTGRLSCQPERAAGCRELKRSVPPLPGLCKF